MEEIKNDEVAEATADEETVEESESEEKESEDKPDDGNLGEQNGKIYGIAKDGRKFYEDSEEVKKYREQYPDVSLEAALGSVVDMYENGTTL